MRCISAKSNVNNYGLRANHPPSRSLFISRQLYLPRYSTDFNICMLSPVPLFLTLGIGIFVALWWILGIGSPITVKFQPLIVSTKNVKIHLMTLELEAWVLQITPCILEYQCLVSMCWCTRCGGMSLLFNLFDHNGLTGLQSGATNI